MINKTNLITNLFRRFSSIENNFVEHLTQSTKGINLNNITDAIRAAPELCNFSPELWQKSHDILTQHGFRTENFITMIVNYPPLIFRREESLIESLECWRGGQFGEKNVLELLGKYPQLLDFKEESILLSKVGYLLDYVGTRKHVWKLLMNSPNLIFEKVNRIEPKINYLKTRMRVDVSEVIQSAVFSNSIEKIECRHIFLDRLGMYKPKSLKADLIEPSKNPKLSHIMDTSDKRFAVKVAFVTLLEFDVFQDLFKAEKERNDLEEISDDD